MPHALRFQPLNDDEQALGMAMTQWALEDPEIMQAVAEFHAAGERCACVAILPEGIDSTDEDADCFVANNVEIQQRYPFAAVIEALQSYDPNDSVCLIIVRRGLVSVSMFGRMK